MKLRNTQYVAGTFRGLCSAALTSLLFVGAAPVWVASAAEEDEEGEIVELSPFEVDASQDQGYRATSTLAGSRINTNLRDIASAITVVTDQFIEDVAAVDVNDILGYMVGAEGTGQFVTQEVQLGSFPTDHTGGNEQTANRIRGLSRADISRNYFYSVSNGWQRGIGFDTYNLDTVTISRGPNSILFGQGSAAGIINYSPMSANVNEDDTEVTFRIGSNSHKRATFNTNYVVVDGVFGVRVAGSWTDQEFRQKPSWLKDNRLYLATEWRPAEKTRIRASYEYIDKYLRTPNSFTPSDHVTPWVEAGMPSLDLSTAPAAVNSEAVAIYDQSGDLEVVYYGMINDAELFSADFPQGFREVGVQNKNWVDYERANFRGAWDQHYAHTFDLSLEQEITPDLFLNLEYFNEDYDFHREGAVRSSLYALRIDDISVLRTGEPNPHYGELFMLSHGLDAVRNRPADNEVYRGTATYNLDLRDRSDWAGRWTVTGMWEKRETRARNDLLDELDVSGRDASNPDRRYYLGGGIDMPATGIYPQSVLINNAPALSWNPNTTMWESTTFTSNYASKRLEESIDEVESRALVLQGYLWDDRIVGTVGVRKDEADNKNRQAAGANATLPSTYNVADSISATTTSYGIMFHATEQFSVFYNQSENFIPKAGTVDLFANPTPYPIGDGKDYGIALHLMEGDLEIKLNWFEMSAKNDHPGEVARILAQWQLPFVEYGFLAPLAEDQLGIDYQYFNPDYSGDPDNPGTGPTGAAIPVWGDGRLEFGSWTSDTEAEGIELEVVYNITDTWRLMFNATQQEAVRSNIATGLLDLVGERLDYWNSVPGLLDTPADSGITAWGAGTTGQDSLNTQILGPYFNIQAAEGKPAPDLNKYRMNLVTNYAFVEGPLEGFSVGGAARWSDKPIIGVPFIYDSSGTIIGSDLDNPYKGDSDFNVDLWVGYRTKIWNDRYDLTLQLNIRDVQESGGLEVIDAAGPHPVTGGRVDQTFAIVQPRSFYLSAKLGF